MRVAHISMIDMTPRFLLLRLFEALKEAGFEVTVICAEGPWTGDLKASGIRHIAWPGATRSWNLRSDAAAFISLVSILRRERFDIVHTHTPKAGVMGRMAARVARVPRVVNTVHGFYATPEDHWVRRSLVLGAEAIAARFSDAELFQSAEDLRWALARRVTPARKAELTRGGVDLGWFDPEQSSGDQIRRELGISPDTVVVGTVGRMVAEKGLREFLSAARTIPSARFVVVGAPDTSKSDAISRAEIRMASDNVIFTGWRSDTRELLAAMDIFVLASWREGVPRSVMEAGAMGKPLIVTDIRGCREIVNDGVEGILVPPRSSVGLAAAISRLVADPGLRLAMGAAARKRCIEEFDDVAVNQQIVRCYRRLLQTPDYVSQPVVRAARPADAAHLAKLHADSLPDAFLPKLGLGFLSRLYRALIVDPSAVVVVADDGAGAVGFAAGVISVRKFYRRFVMRNGLGAGVRLAPRLIRPSVIQGVMETARYPNGNGHLPEAELLAIAVASGYRGRGLGRELARRVLEGLSQRGATSAKVVVAGANVDANRFYEETGFHPCGAVEVHRGIPSTVLVARWPS